MWAVGLVHCVTEEAKDQEQPSVIADVQGNAYVAVAAIGPCLLAWPLRAQRLQDNSLALLWIDNAAMRDVFLTDPFR